MNLNYKDFYKILDTIVNADKLQLELFGDEINFESFKDIKDKDTMTECLIDTVYSQLDEDYLLEEGLDQFNVKYIPKELLREDLLISSLYINTNIFKNTPNECKTYNLCLLAVKIDPNLIEYVPKELLTTEIYEVATFLDEKIFKNVPDEFKSTGMCIRAIDHNIDNIKYVPYHLLTVDMYKFILYNKYNLHDYFNFDNVNIELFKDAVFEYINEMNNINPSSEEEALKLFYKIPKSFKYIPDKYKSKDMCLMALDYDAHNIKYVPHDLKDKYLCGLAFNKDVYSFRFIPDEYKTLEMCKIILAFNKEYLDFVPENIRKKLKNL